MKAKALLVILCLIGIVTTSDAQMKKVKLRNNQPAAFSPVHKGYYTIGRNAEKLNAPSSGIITEETYQAPAVQKGYYAIGNNNERLKRQQRIRQEHKNTGIKTPRKKAWPVKGYYGIGNNAEKLQ